MPMQNNIPKDYGKGSRANIKIQRYQETVDNNWKHLK